MKKSLAHILMHLFSTVFSLYGCVCHFGCVGGGHYTAYSRHLVTGTWNYYDDNVISDNKVPGESVGDNSSAYILFYQRNGNSYFQKKFSTLLLIGFSHRLPHGHWLSNVEPPMSSICFTIEWAYRLGNLICTFKMFFYEKFLLKILPFSPEMPAQAFRRCSQPCQKEVFFITSRMRKMRWILASFFSPFFTLDL